jgi:hypothetical protein
VFLLGAHSRPYGWIQMGGMREFSASRRSDALYQKQYREQTQKQSSFHIFRPLSRLASVDGMPG